MTHSPEELRDLLAKATPTERVARYVQMRDEKPLRNQDDLITRLHTGTEWEAELTLSDLRALLDEHDRLAKRIVFDLEPRALAAEAARDQALAEVERLAIALNTIANIEPVTDFLSGYSDTSCQDSARAALKDTAHV